MARKERTLNAVEKVKGGDEVKGGWEQWPFALLTHPNTWRVLTPFESPQ